LRASGLAARTHRPGRKEALPASPRRGMGPPGNRRGDVPSTWDEPIRPKVGGATRPRLRKTKNTTTRKGLAAARGHIAAALDHEVDAGDVVAVHLLRRLQPAHVQPRPVAELLKRAQPTQWPDFELTVLDTPS